MKAVLDANVIISAIYTFEIPRSRIAQVLRSGLRGRFALVVSDHIMTEVESALSKPFFTDRLAKSLIDRILEDLRREATVTELGQLVEGVATHWQDDLVLSTALSGDAGFLVTGDRELLDLDHEFPFQIVHPNDFAIMLDLLG